MDMCKSVKVKFTNRAIGACKGYWVVNMGKMCLLGLVKKWVFVKGVKVKFTNL